MSREDKKKPKLSAKEKKAKKQEKKQNKHQKIDNFGLGQQVE